MAEQTYYYCLRHHAVEGRDGCRAEDRIGPYPTRQAAEGWRQQYDERNARLDREDAAWRGDDVDED